MKKIIREFDKHGRINLKSDLLELSGIKRESQVAICFLDENRIMLRNLDNLKDCQVVGLARVDDKGRIIISTDIREETKKMEMFVSNNNLILKEAH
jgi:hypothetical protein